MALVKPECAAHLPRTEIERHISVGHAVAGYVCLQCSPAVACSLSRAISHPLAMRSLSVGVLALAYVQGLGASLPSSRSPRPGEDDFPRRGSSGAVQSSRRLRQGCHHAACWRPHGLPTAGRRRGTVVSTLLARRDDVVGRFRIFHVEPDELCVCAALLIHLTLSRLVCTLAWLVLAPAVAKSLRLLWAIPEVCGRCGDAVPAVADLHMRGSAVHVTSSAGVRSVS